jgi:hypothetical protein
MWRIARQRLAKHVSERYAVNENRRPLLDNGFCYHGIAGVSGTTQTWNTVVEPLQLVSSVAAAKQLYRVQKSRIRDSRD